MSTLTLRPITPEDLPFLRRVYASTRTEELAVVNWPPEQIEAFLDMQFNAQHQHYQQHYREAEFSVIEVDGVPAGRLYVSRWADQIRIVDITLLPEFRGHGYGTQLLEPLLAEGRESKKPVTIHVEALNRARTLYDRLGFRVVDDSHPVYLLMEWRG